MTCAEPVWQKAFDELKPEIMAVSNYILKFASGVVNGLVDVFNYKLAHNDNFVFNVAGLPLNLTMTKAPESNSTENEIKLHIDAQFGDVAEMSQYVSPDTTWAPWEDQKQKEQLWIH